MIRKGYSLLVLFMVLLFIATPLLNGKNRENKPGPVSADLKDNIVRKSHSILLNGIKISYDSFAGTMVLKGENKRPDASFFFISYMKRGVSDRSKRPVIFSFNGGPGSSSVWLHLGLLGPKRVLMKDDGSMPPPPYKLVTNKYTVLDSSDLVFIDPVSTGFSRTGSPEKEKEFHGVSEDIASVGDFIRLYLSRYNRWTSPKYLIGESYGTTRAAGLSGYLQGRHGIYLNGIILVSSVLDHKTLRFSFGNDLPPLLFLPTYAATAWYHGKLSGKYGDDLGKVLKDAEEFALGKYAAVLLRGNKIDPEEFNNIAERLSSLTSLSLQFIKENNLRIPAHKFFLELLNETGEKTGRLDSRFKRFNGNLGFSEDEGFFSDPSYSAIQGPYTETLNNYVSKELGFRSDLIYEIITHRIRGWKTGKYEGRYVNVSDTLAKAMTTNPYLKIFVASGYYDLATPYFATKYTFDHLFLPENLKKNITFKYYNAGHMMYINLISLKKLKKDLDAFIKSSLPGSS